jgi:hypothetical protein
MRLANAQADQRASTMQGASSRTAGSIPAVHLAGIAGKAIRRNSIGG